MKIYIHSDNTKNAESERSTTSNCVNLLGAQEVELRMENNELYKVYGYNGKIYSQNDEMSEVIGEIVEPIREIVTLDKKDICFISYGEKTTGKSTILGTLPSFSDNEDNICFYTLVTLFTQIEHERSIQKSAALRIVAFEIFVDQIIDLSNDSYQDSKYDCNCITAYTISDAVNVLKTIFSKRNQYIQQLEDEDTDISFSLSHLVIELSIESESGSGIVSIVDLVGFDSNFTTKIMQGNTDMIPEDCSEEEFVTHHNDYSLFSLRNMLLEMHNESYMAFDTHLAQYIYEKIVDHTTYVSLIGKINNSKETFHETLNTLEFCSKFMHSRCSHKDADSIMVSNDFTHLENILDPKCNTQPLRMSSEFSVKSDGNTETIIYNQINDQRKLHHQNGCREVQISYLDNNCSSIRPDSPPGYNTEGHPSRIEIPHLRIGNPKEALMLENSEIIESSEATSEINSSQQYSVLSGESKESLKGNIQ